MNKKHLKKIQESKAQDQISRDLWLVHNMSIAVPRIIQPLFKKAILSNWTKTMKVFIWLFNLEIRFAKDGNEIINVAIFRNGEIVKAWKEPEVIDINSIKRNGVAVNGTN